MTDKPRPRKSTIAILDKEFLAEHGFRASIKQNQILNVLYNESQEFYTLLKRNDTYFVIKTDTENEVKYIESKDRKVAEECFKDIITEAQEQGEKLSILDL